MKEARVIELYDALKGHSDAVMVNGRSFSSSLQVVKLEAEVKGNGLLDIRIHERKDGKLRVREITYSGSFSVKWAGEDDDEDSE